MKQLDRTSNLIDNPTVVDLFLGDDLVVVLTADRVQQEVLLDEETATLVAAFILAGQEVSFWDGASLLVTGFDPSRGLTTLFVPGYALDDEKGAG